MSQEEPIDQPGERRLLPRYPSSAHALVIRDTDQMRTGIQARIKDISVGGVGIFLPETLAVGEHVKLRLKNPIQHVDKEVRGTVRHVRLHKDGLYHIGIALFTRLTPLEVVLLRQGLDKPADDGPRLV
jgi:hypothetical protein